MIPKVIHYCWFGGNKLPDNVKKCINSWRRYCPDFEIKEWNENNFNVNCCDYVREAYEKKEWAFVSDFARFWILYNYGGVYFDTDVELIKPINEILSNGAFMACETKKSINPGLGIAAPIGLKTYKDILDYYSTQHFLYSDGTENVETVVTRVTKLFVRKGFVGTDNIEKIGDITIYPTRYFCPLNYKTKKIDIQKDTVAIHHYTATWHSTLDNIIFYIEESGKIKNVNFRNLLSLPFRVLNKCEKYGVEKTIKLSLKKINDKLS